jgi:hypothetical protein
MSFLFAVTLDAQVHVSATQALTAATNYTTLSAAFEAINNGTHRGAVLVQISTNITETSTCRLAASGTGPASYSSLRVKPEGMQAPVVSATLHTPLILLDGASNVTIDGLNAFEQGRSLTFVNYQVSSNGAAICFSGGATGNLIRNCVLKGAGDAVFLMLYSFHDNTVENNEITNAIPNLLPYSSIHLLADLPYCSGNKFLRNQVSNFKFAGFWDGEWAPVGYTRNTVIEGNEFFNTTASPATGSAIFLETFVAKGYRISGNYIHDLQGQGSLMPMCGINFWDVDTIEISNNIIRLDAQTGLQVYGILMGTDIGHVRVCYNTIWIGGAGTGAYSAAIAKWGRSADDTLRNNIFINTRVGGMAPTNYQAAIALPDDSSFRRRFSSDYNVLYSSGSADNVIGAFVSTTNSSAISRYAGLGSWSAASGQELHSVSVMPQFLSATDLHLLPFGNDSIRRKGVPVPHITTDFDGESRHPLQPDIGADELTVVATAIPGLASSDWGYASIWPGLVRNEARLRVQSRSAQVLRWSIIDGGGNTLRRFTQALAPGENFLPLHLAALSPGTYTCVGMPGKGEHIVLRFVRQ